MKPPSYFEMGHNHGEERKLNSAIDQVVKGLPNRTSKEDNKKYICYFLYPPWATSGWSCCVVIRLDALFINILIQQLLEYSCQWLRALVTALPGVADCQQMACLQSLGMQG